LPRGLCYWNVDRLVRDFGGDMVVGWQHLWWPGRLAVSTHHAIWRKPDGSLLDVTQKEQTDRDEGITFSPDTSLEVDLSWPMFVPNVYLHLSEHNLVERAVRAFDQQMAVAREARDYVKAKKGVFIPGSGLKLPFGHMPHRITSKARSTNKTYRNVIKQCGNLTRQHPLFESSAYGG